MNTILRENKIVSLLEAFPESESQLSAKQHMNRMLKLVRDCHEKELDDLTEDEKFALCFFSGCEIDYMHFNESTQSFIPITKYPCGIQKIYGKFVVFESRS